MSISASIAGFCPLCVLVSVLLVCKMRTPVASKLHSWTPLLDEDLTQTALVSIEEIASALEAKLKNGRNESVSAELGDGAAGIATFFAYLHAARNFPGAREFALQYTDIAADALAVQPMGPGLYAGFTGIAWTVQHINDLLLGPASQDQCSEIDDALEVYLSRSPWKEDYDLISGLAGLGVYCLERTGSTGAIRCLELIVGRLSELAEPCEDGLRWFTGPGLLTQQQLELYPHGFYNFGLAHGVPGIIALLSRIQAAGIAVEEAGRLLDGAVRWLLRQQLPDNAISSFPSMVAPDQAPGTSRLAWCYGDAGIAAALLLAARLTGSKEWEQHALVVARRAAMRDLQSCGVVDSCFCHGSAGLAHIFNRLYQATQEELFSWTARYWIERTIQFRMPGTGAAGYSVLTARDREKPRRHASFGIIEGIAGIGLTLLAAISEVEPNWDRVFMVDVPPRPLVQP